MLNLDITNSDEIAGWISGYNLDFNKLLSGLQNMYKQKEDVKTLADKIVTVLKNRDKTGRNIPKMISIQPTPSIYSDINYKSIDYTRYNIYNNLVDTLGPTTIKKVNDTKIFKAKMKILEFLALQAGKGHDTGLYTINELDKNDMLSYVLDVSLAENNVTISELLKNINITNTDKFDVLDPTMYIRYNMIDDLIKKKDEFTNKYKIYEYVNKLRYVLGKPLYFPIKLQDVLQEMYPINIETPDETTAVVIPEDVQHLYADVLQINTDMLLYMLDDEYITTENGYIDSINNNIKYLPEFDQSFHKKESFLKGRLANYYSNIHNKDKVFEVINKLKEKIIACVNDWDKDKVVLLYKLPEITLNKEISLEKDIIPTGVEWPILRRLFELYYGATIDKTISIDSSALLTNLNNLTESEQNKLNQIFFNAKNKYLKNKKYNELMDKSKYGINLDRYNKITRELKTYKTDVTKRPSELYKNPTMGELGSINILPDKTKVWKKFEDVTGATYDVLEQVSSEVTINLYDLVTDMSKFKTDEKDLSGYKSINKIDKDKDYRDYNKLLDTIANIGTKALSTGVDKFKELVADDTKPSNVIMNSTISSIGYSIYNQIFDRTVPAQHKPMFRNMEVNITNVFNNFLDLQRYDKEIELNNKYIDETPSMKQYNSMKAIMNDSIIKSMDTSTLSNLVPKESVNTIENVHKNEFTLGVNLSKIDLEGVNRGDFSINKPNLNDLKFVPYIFKNNKFDAYMQEVRYKEYYERRKKDLEYSRNILKRTQNKAILETILGKKIEDVDWVQKFKDNKFRGGILDILNNGFESLMNNTGFTDKYNEIINDVDNVANGMMNNLDNVVNKVSGAVNEVKKIKGKLSKAFKDGEVLFNKARTTFGPLVSGLMDFNKDTFKNKSFGDFMSGFSKLTNDEPVPKLSYMQNDLFTKITSIKLDNKDIGYFKLINYVEVMDYLDGSIAKREITYQVPVAQIDRYVKFPTTGLSIDITRTYFKPIVDGLHKLKPGDINVEEQILMDRVCASYVARLKNTVKPSIDLSKKKIKDLKENAPQAEGEKMLEVTLELIPIIAAKDANVGIPKIPYISQVARYDEEEKAKDKIEKVKDKNKSSNPFGGILSTLGASPTLGEFASKIINTVNSVPMLKASTELLGKNATLFTDKLDQISGGKINWDDVVKYTNAGIKLFDAGMDTYNRAKDFGNSYGDFVMGIADNINNHTNYFKNLLTPSDSGGFAVTTKINDYKHDKKLPNNINLKRLYSYDIITDFDDNVMEAKEVINNTNPNLGFIGSEPTTLRGNAISVDTLSASTARLL